MRRLTDFVGPQWKLSWTALLEMSLPVLGFTVARQRTPNFSRGSRLSVPVIHRSAEQRHSVVSGAAVSRASSLDMRRSGLLRWFRLIRLASAALTTRHGREANGR